MPDGGWLCCCCTVADYEFCSLCLQAAITEPWLESEWRDVEGEWGCDYEADPELCSGYPLTESTGAGRIVSRVPLTNHHTVYLAFLSTTLEDGDKVGLFVVWKDSLNYLELVYTAVSSVAATLELIEHVDGVATVLQSCAISLYYGTHSASLSACLQGNLCIGICEGGRVVAESNNVSGQLGGFWHATTNPIGYTRYTATELDPPDYATKKPATFPPRYCGTCLTCACEDVMYGYVPIEWDATLLVESGDPVFDACWNGLTFRLRPQQGCVDADVETEWYGDMPDPSGACSADPLKVRQFKLVCANPGVVGGFPWDYVGPWRFVTVAEYPHTVWAGSSCYGVAPPQIGLCDCQAALGTFDCYTDLNEIIVGGHQVTIRRDLSTCEPLVLVFEGQTQAASWCDYEIWNPNPLRCKCPTDCDPIRCLFQDFDPAPPGEGDPMPTLTFRWVLTPAVVE